MKTGNPFSVGFARADITPEESVPLSGYGNTMKRLSQGALDPLFATCIAFTDSEDHSLVLYTIDAGNAMESFCNPVRKHISQKYGIPQKNVIICATHTHSAPDFWTPDYPPIARYIEYLTEKLIALADLALADRKPASLLVGQSRTEGMNFVRHNILENDTCAGDNYGDFSSAPIRGHVSEADRQIQLVKICRQGAKDILMVNWQAHPTKASTGVTEYGRQHRPYITAGFVGSCRSYIEEKEDVYFAYFQGACGNLNSRSNIQEEDAVHEHIPYGQQLGDYILAGLDSLMPIGCGAIAANETVYHSAINHSENHLIPLAEKIRKLWTETNDYPLCIAQGRPHGIHSPYHANAILRKAAMEGDLPLTLGAGYVGDLGFAVLPYEVFDTNGKHIKDNSPFAMTFILECANGSESYIPSVNSFKHGCYEADLCYYAPGTAEEAADIVLQLLDQLHPEKDS